MTRTRITTVNDLYNWVDDMTSGWLERTYCDVERISETLRGMPHPPYGTDWAHWLETLPDLTELL
jgi:hypothetical protein